MLTKRMAASRFGRTKPGIDKPEPEPKFEWNRVWQLQGRPLAAVAEIFRSRSVSRADQQLLQRQIPAARTAELRSDGGRSEDDDTRWLQQRSTFGSDVDGPLTAMVAPRKADGANGGDAMEHGAAAVTESTPHLSRVSPSRWRNWQQQGQTAAMGLTGFLSALRSASVLVSATTMTTRQRLRGYDGSGEDPPNSASP
ncbi:uncharacterized protein DS421_4g128820 [Arachis hypogaea]|nr:uncharacterized protein DS421_4g128820 [Arachis hypogaea]